MYSKATGSKINFMFLLFFGIIIVKVGDKMKKKIFYMFCFALLSFTMCSLAVFADYSARIVSTDKCKLYHDKTKKTASGSCLYANTNFTSLSSSSWVDVGDSVTVITSKGNITPPKTGYGSECKTSFVYIKIPYGSGVDYGYVCKDHIWDGTIPNNIKTEISAFPSTYQESLAVMKISHPNWKFIPINTGLNFNDAVAGENYSGKSLMQVTGSVNNQGYLSTAEADYNYLTDKFIAHDSTTWFQARKETIAYFMDPRNSLSDMYIFQFETLAYIEDPNHLSVIQTMLTGQYMYKFANYFVNAGKSAKVNPVYLASLSKQEVGGTNANPAISGAAFTYGGKTYSGLYNFYNIGATSSTNPVYLGLIYANGGADGKTITYSRPWKNEQTAILGGAQFIANQYIQYGQSTSYFKKWNVVHNYAKAAGLSTNKLYTNQYMTNIQAPRSEALSTYNSYQKLDRINDAFTFYIPVYNNMPSTTSLPAKGNPNNYLKTLTVSLNGGAATKISGFESATENYSFHVNNSITKATIAGTVINSNASVTGTGTKNLAVGDNKWTIVVTAQNGEKKTYTVNIVRDAATSTGTVTIKSVEEVIKQSGLNIDGDYLTGLTFTTSVSNIESQINKVESSASVTVKNGSSVVTSGNLVTGETVTITSNGKSKTYTVVLYGDLNGDGKVNALDLLKVQKHILGINKLTGASLKASDPSKDGKVNALDLLKVQKHILGIAFIDQQ